MTGTPPPAPPALTGQDIAEAQGALAAVLERTLNGSGATSAEYITLRVIAVRGPFSDLATLTSYLASQLQLRLSERDAESLLDRLVHKGLISGGPVALTEAGSDLYAQLGGRVAANAGPLYAGLDHHDLAVARQVLAELTERANRILHQA
jgi:hypothetical protein